MNCEKVRTQLTAYLDGELADDRGSAVRGHLRGCDDCRRAASDEAALRDGLRALPPVDPPASLWAGVQARLAEEEVADSQRPAWRRALTRWMPKAPQVGLAGAAVAAAVIFLVVRSRGESEATVSPPPAIQQVVLKAEQTMPTPPSVDDSTDVTAAIAAEPARVTGDYAQAASELLALAREARVRWSDEDKREFDTRVAELQKRVTAADGERPRQQAYRALIRYLQRAAIRDDVMLASTGGAR